MAEKMATADRGFDQLIGDWNRALQGHLEVEVTARVETAKKGLSGQTRGVLEDIKTKKEQFHSGLKDSLSSQSREMKDGLNRKIDRLKVFSRKKND